MQAVPLSAGNWTLLMRILVMRPGALGDVILTLPALQALRTRFPQAEIEVMGNLPVLEWLCGRSVVTSVASFDRADLGALFLPEAEPDASLLAYLAAFDTVLSYVTPPEHAFARNLARATCGRTVSFDPRPRAGEVVHVSELLQRPLCGLKVTPTRETPRLQSSAADRLVAARWWTERGLNGRWVLAMHPGSGSPAKNWPAQHFAAVGLELARRGGARILLLGGPADAAAVEQVRRALYGTPWVELLDAPLPCLAALLACCRAYVGNDSGVSHLAAALGVPTVAVFGPTDPRLWAPRGRQVRVVQHSLACWPCGVDQRRVCVARRCLEAVSSDEVVRAVEEWNQ
jgi:ADP-heptose:LPS heptosyltransferase